MTDLIVGYGRFDAYGKEITPPGTDIVKSSGEQVICAERSTPAASGEVLSAGRTAPYEDSDQQENVSPTRDLIKQIAMDIGKETVAYIEWMYPNAIAATSSTFKTSIKHHVYNEIMAAIKVNEEGQIVARLKEREKTRRYIRKLRKVKNVEDYNDVANEYGKRTI